MTNLDLRADHGRVMEARSLDEARTIVLSDAHGYPQMIAEALEHARFEPGVDRLIYAGDFLDRGDRPEECLSMLEDAGAEMLWGNHEVAVLLSQTIFPQGRESLGFWERLLQRFETGAWQLVTCVGDVLVSHAGISSEYSRAFALVGFSSEALAARINEEFREAAERGLADERLGEPCRVLDERGPLWMRPDWEGPEGMLAGVAQVAGHTAPAGRIVRELRDAGVHLIDPGAARAWGASDLPPCRYAVISGEAIAVLQEDGAPDPATPRACPTAGGRIGRRFPKEVHLCLPMSNC